MTRHRRPDELITTPEEFAAARAKLGLSLAELGEALGLGGGREQAAKRVRQMETGFKDISGPVARVLQAMLAGWRPSDPRRTADLRTVRRVLEATTGLQAKADAALQEGKDAEALGISDTALQRYAYANGLSAAVNAVVEVLEEFVG